MGEVVGSDLLVEFDVVAEDLLDILDAGLPSGRGKGSNNGTVGWDSKQIVAHIVELCEFFRADIEQGIRRPKSVVLGRSAHDEGRNSRIEALCALTASELIEQLTLEIGKCAGLLASLDDVDFSLQITHLTDGQITITELISKQLITHVTEHVDQLKELEEIPSTT